MLQPSSTYGHSRNLTKTGRKSIRPPYNQTMSLCRETQVTLDHLYPPSQLNFITNNLLKADTCFSGPLISISLPSIHAGMLSYSYRYGMLSLVIWLHLPLLVMPLPGQLGKWMHNVLNLSVCRSSDLWTRYCENEPVLMKIGTSGPNGKGMEWSNFGVRRSNVTGSRR